jgi:hypothetical protein
VRGWGAEGGGGGKGGIGGKGGEMTQTLYEHMNKRKKKTILLNFHICVSFLVFLLLLISGPIPLCSEKKVTYFDFLLLLLFGNIGV